MGEDIQVLLSPRMPTDQIVALLIAERDKLTRAIEVLQGARRRGLASEEPVGTDGFNYGDGSHPQRTQGWNDRRSAEGAVEEDEGVLGEEEEGFLQVARNF
jgi:hypothetical protein